MQSHHPSLSRLAHLGIAKHDYGEGLVKPAIVALPMHQFLAVAGEVLTIPILAERKVITTRYY